MAAAPTPTSLPTGMTAPAGAVINQGQGNYTVPGTGSSQQTVGANGALATQPTTIANYDPTNNSPLVQGPNGQMVYSQPTPAPVTEQTAGAVYGTTGNAGLDAALQAQEGAANNAANAPDPNDPTVQAGIRAATLASFQQEIDDTNASYAREMSSAVAAGNVGIGNARLQGLYTGEQGSAGAAAGVYNATAKSQSDQATITDQQNTAIDALMDKSNAAADATIAADKASKQAGLDARVTYLQGAQTRNAANAQTAATDAVAAGIDPTQMTPAQIQQYLTNYGISQQDFNSAYATAKQAAADAAVKNEKTVAAGDTVIGADGKPIYTAPDKPAAAPSSVQEYEYATANSGYKGTYTDWLKQQANLKIVQPKATPAADVPNANGLTPLQQTTYDNYTKALANNTDLTKTTGSITREQFIRQLQSEFPTMNASQIQNDVYSTYPDGSTPPQ